MSQQETTTVIDQEDRPSDPKRHRCAQCGERALFITPVGLLCRDHAMAATLSQVKGDDRWMPVPITASLKSAD